MDRTNENDYVNIFKGKKGDCHANLGRVGGEQPLSLGEGCPGTGVVTHELMHTLGRHCLRVWEANVLPSNLIKHNKYSEKNIFSLLIIRMVA